MTFLDHPVWPFETDWSGDVTKRFTYDVRAQQIGFGAEVTEPLQQHLAVGFQFSLSLDSQCAINRFERFVQAVQGALRAWWLPGPMHELVILRQHSSTQIDIAACGLAASWELHPCRFLWLRDDESNANAAVQISAVEVVDEGTERITLTEALADPIDDGWSATRLYFVRFAKDELKQRYRAPWRASVDITCYELPLEYLAAELGDRPIYLYKFSHTTAGVSEAWYFTSHDVPVDHLAQTWAPAPISHGELALSMSADTNSVDVESWRFTGNPLNDFFPYAPQFVLQVTIRELLVGSAESRILFQGVVQNVDTVGRLQTAHCVSRLDGESRQIPRFLMQHTCPYTLFEAHTCRVDPADYVVAGTVTAIAGQQVTVTGPFGGKPAGWFAFGYVIAAAPSGRKELRHIRQNVAALSGSCVLFLGSAFDKVQLGAAISVYPGCDLRAATCKAKFNNYVNFGGMPWIGQNLALKAIKQDQKTGGAKKG